MSIIKHPSGISATIIAHSISPVGTPICTMQLRYPRFIHSEFMTHRVFSRNAASSRAIPVAKMIEQVRNDPAMPVFWGKNQPGMQAREESRACDVLMSVSWRDGKNVPLEYCTAEHWWRRAADSAAGRAESLAEAGYHKQIVNRLLEPWQWMQTIVTATEWQNFFDLRCHLDAQPEMRVLAECMRDAQNSSTPIFVDDEQWHLPYVDASEAITFGLAMAIKCSVARCARVSYLTHEGKEPDIDADLKLYDRLVGSKPMHASPAEHQARPLGDADPIEFTGNFLGWVQYRKFLDFDSDIE